MRPSEVSAIITSLWCSVFVVWCPHSPLLFLIHPLHHPLVVRLSVEWVDMQSHIPKERGQHTGVLVWVVCAIVWCGVCWVSESVGRRVVAWWIERGEGRSERDGHKSKKTLFSLKPLFSFLSLFQTLSFPDSLMLSHHSLSITQSTPFSSTRHVHICNEHKPKTTQHSIYLSCFSHVHFLFYIVFPLQIVFFWWSFNNYYYKCAK